MHISTQNKELEQITFEIKWKHCRFCSWCEVICWEKKLNDEEKNGKWKVQRKDLQFGEAIQIQNMHFSSIVQA